MPDILSIAEIEAMLHDVEMLEIGNRALYNTPAPQPKRSCLAGVRYCLRCGTWIIGNNHLCFECDIYPKDVYYIMED